MDQPVRTHIFLFIYFILSVLEYNETSGFYKLVNNIYNSYRNSETGKIGDYQMYPSLGKFIDVAVFQNGEDIEKFDVSSNDVAGYFLVYNILYHFSLHIHFV